MSIVSSSTNSFDWKDKALRAADTHQYAYDTYEVSVQSPMVQVFNNEEWVLPAVRSIHLSAAANEYESIQLVIKPRLKGLIGVHFEFTDLGHTDVSEVVIAASNIRCRPVGYVRGEFRQLYNPSMMYPDVVLNQDVHDIAPEEVAHPFWLTVYVPPKTPPGRYEGTMIVFAQNAHTTEIPISVTVWNFELPLEQSLSTDFALRPNLLGKFFGDVRTWGYPAWQESVTPEDYRRWVKFFLDYRITPQPYGEGGSGLADDTGPSNYPYTPFLEAHWEGDELVVDWTEVDKIWELMIDNGAKVIRACYIGDAFNDLDSESTRFFKAYLPQLRDHLDQRGWLDSAYVYGRDEPPLHMYDLVRRQADAVHQLAPGLDFLLTIQSTHPEKLCGYIDVWCPPFGNYDKAAASARKALGEKVWAYTGVCGIAAPNLYIYEQHIMHRLAPWVCMQQDIQGLLYYALVAWPIPWDKLNLDDVAEDGTILPSWKPERMGGVLAYPGGKKITDEPQASIRLENLRDGMEDYEYMVILQRMVADADAQGVSSYLIEEARVMCLPPPCLVRGPYDYIPSAEVLARQRNSIGATIHKLRQALGSD